MSSTSARAKSAHEILATVLVTATGFGTMSCRTTQEQAAVVHTVPGGLDPVLELDKGEEQDLYLKMLSVELNNGVKVPKGQLHTTRGVAECHRDGSAENPLDSCVLRVRIMDRELSESQPLSTALTTKVWAYARTARPELVEERRIVADVTCDYIGKKSPPYQIESVECKAMHPRTLNEAIFSDPIATELAEGLQGERAFGDGMTHVSGSISCRWVEGSTRTPCVVRAIVGGILQEKVTEISAAASLPIARKLLQALLDHHKLDRENLGQWQPPSELMGSITCTVDSRSVAASGHRQHICRARI